jgi:hypothetical protein
VPSCDFSDTLLEELHAAHLYTFIWPLLLHWWDCQTLHATV